MSACINYIIPNRRQLFQEPEISVGVVNRATTRATAKFSILAWSVSNPQNPIVQSPENPENEDEQQNQNSTSDETS